MPVKEKKKEKKERVPVPKVSMSERLSNYLCPMLLGGTVCFATIYALYRPMAYLYTVLFLAAEFILFMLFDWLKKRPKLGGILYTVMLLVVEFVAMNLLFTGMYVSGSYMGPVTWFYGEEGSFAYEPYYLAAMMIGGGFFIVSILYYFTQIRYRTLGAMMCILFPFVIYAKRADIMPDIVVTLIVTMLIAVMVHNRRIDPSMPKAARGTLRVDLSYIISVALFVSITGAVTMMIDKPTYMSELEKNANFFNYYSTSIGAGNYERLSDESSQRYGAGSNSQDPIFYFETNGEDDEYFLRSTSYDYFNGEVWAQYDSSGDYAYVYSTVIPEYSYDDIISDMTVIVSNAGKVGTITSISGSIPVRQGRIYDEDFNPVYLPAPYGIITDYDTLAKLPYRKYAQGTVIRRAAVTSDEPPVVNDSFDFLEPNAAYHSYAASLRLNGEEYENLLIDDGGDEAYQLYMDYYAAKDRYLGLENTSDRIIELAQEIVKDCESDYEKAYALEQYFTDNGYIYDLDYVPEDTSIDYFIFEGKTGVCSSYATAMTMMARAVGLPARYTEGFACFEPAEGETTIDNARNFVIRDSQAHAFVEVYIPGAGWLTFDPTVPDYKQIQQQADAGRFTAFLQILSRLMIVLIVGFIIVFVMLLDRFAELAVRLRLLFLSPHRQVLVLYKHVIWLTNFSTKRDYSAYTVAMLREYLTGTRGCSPDKLFALFERVCFGGHEPAAEEWREAYAEYRRCYKYLRKLPKPKKIRKQAAAEV